MTGLMQGKRGLIMGLANDRSLAWGISRALAAHGAELAFSYQGEALERRVRPLAGELGADFLVECDVARGDAMHDLVVLRGAQRRREAPVHEPDPGRGRYPSRNRRGAPSRRFPPRPPLSPAAMLPAPGMQAAGKGGC